jgi:hypothetical protein
VFLSEIRTNTNQQRRFSRQLVLIDPRKGGEETGRFTCVAAGPSFASGGVVGGRKKMRGGTLVLLGGDGGSDEPC